MKSWAVLFDLDGTLVETQTIKPLRDRRRWQEAYAAFDSTELLPGARELVAAAAQFAHVGVITMAPRPYAERLLRHHEIAVPVLVAYHDVPRGQLKPHPRPLLQAAEALGVAPARAIYIGDEIRDIVAAHAAGMHAIGYGSGVRHEPKAASAAAFAADWTEVAEAVRRITGQ